MTTREDEIRARLEALRQNPGEVPWSDWAGSTIVADIAYLLGEVRRLRGLLNSVELPAQFNIEVGQAPEDQT